MTRISVNSNQVQANASSFAPALNRDSRFVAFTSSATNIDIAASHQQIYVHDRDSGQTVLLSKTNDGLAGNGDSDQASISDSGRMLFTNRQQITWCLITVATTLQGHYDLWTSDGTTGGTQKLLSLNASELREITAIDHRFAFVAKREQLELWLSDGTAAGSRVIFATDRNDGYIDNLLVTSRQLLFAADRIVENTTLDIPDWPEGIPHIQNLGQELYGYQLIPIPTLKSTT